MFFKSQHCVFLRSSNISQLWYPIILRILLQQNVCWVMLHNSISSYLCANIQQMRLGVDTWQVNIYHSLFQAYMTLQRESSFFLICSAQYSVIIKTTTRTTKDGTCHDANNYDVNSIMISIHVILPQFATYVIWWDKVYLLECCKCNNNNDMDDNCLVWYSKRTGQGQTSMDS